MEVRLEALEGQTVPQDTYLSLRIGAVQKQSRFGGPGGDRTFHFPEPKDGSKADFGRIEVYKKIGHCNVPLAGLDEFPRDLQITLGDSTLPELGLRVQITPETVVAAQERKTDKSKRKKEKLDDAQRYLADHNLEELLAASLRDVMRKQPGDPASYLSGQIMEKKSKPSLPPLGEAKRAKSKNGNRSASEPRIGRGGKSKPPDEATSPTTKSRPSAPPKVPALVPPEEEPPSVIPAKALSRSASTPGLGPSAANQESPKAAPQPAPPRLEPTEPDFRVAPAEFWTSLHAHFRREPSPGGASCASPTSPSASVGRQAEADAGAPLPLQAPPPPPGALAGGEKAADASPKAAPPAAAEQIELAAAAEAPPAASRPPTSPGSVGMLARSFPLPQPPVMPAGPLGYSSPALLGGSPAAPGTGSPPLSYSSPFPLRQAVPANPAVSPVRLQGGKIDPGYIADLKGAISAKEAKLRALAAQLQELSRLQMQTQPAQPQMQAH